MQKVKEWLDGKRNFIIGRAIYKALGTDTRIKNLLDKGCTVYSMQQLIEAMEALFAPPIAAEPDMPAATPQRAPADAHAAMPAGNDAVLKAIQNEWLKPYKKMCYLQAQLDRYGSSNEPDAVAYRSPIAAEILELEQQCIKLWEKRDHYLEYGELPADKTKVVEVPTDPIQLATLINRIKRNIRTNRLQMLRQPDKSSFAKKYLTYKTQFQQITGKQYEEVDNE